MSVLTVPEKLEKLRELMRNQHVDALIVMSADPYVRIFTRLLESKAVVKRF